jgi:hypothetical protein
MPKENSKGHRQKIRMKHYGNNQKRIHVTIKQILKIQELQMMHVTANVYWKTTEVNEEAKWTSKYEDDNIISDVPNFHDHFDTISMKTLRSFHDFLYKLTKILKYIWEPT